MSLPRFQLFELEDLTWFPQTIRNLATDYLHFMDTRFSLHKPVVPVLRAMLEKSKTSCIVDLCSGAGGPILSLYEVLLPDQDQIQFTLTDKYPNIDAFQRLSSQYPSGIRYVADPVDATNVPKDLAGMRIMFNAFHHFPPQSARLVLENAVQAQRPIGIFEFVERSLPILVSFMFTPIFVMFATPFIRPFLLKRLLWTYLIPLVPLACWWDGLISACRAYSVTEILDMTEGFVDYDWKADRVKIQGTMAYLTYLVGIPRSSGVSKSEAMETAGSRGNSPHSEPIPD
jgi:hypothetical protein